MAVKLYEIKNKKNTKISDKFQNNYYFSANV